jgi:hypothetical protein
MPLPLLKLALHESVALAGGFFQLSPVDNPDVAASVGD